MTAMYRRMLEIGVARTNLLYGGLEIAETTSNIVFVHGGNDPWHAAGVIGSVNPKSPVIYVEGRLFNRILIVVYCTI